MKVSLYIEPYTLSFPQRLTTAQVRLEERRGWRLWLAEGDRLLGLGEVAPWVGFGDGLENAEAEINTYLQSETHQGATQEALSDMLGNGEALASLRQALDRCESLVRRIDLLSAYLDPITSLFKCLEFRYGIELAVLDALLETQHADLE